MPVEKWEDVQSDALDAADRAYAETFRAEFYKAQDEAEDEDDICAARARAIRICAMEAGVSAYLKAIKTQGYQLVCLAS